jgi:hypothetical protein
MAFDPEHARWAIDQRAKIQHTLLTLYIHLDVLDPEAVPFALSEYIDDLIAAAFSLWRAYFWPITYVYFPTLRMLRRSFSKR